MKNKLLIICLLTVLSFIIYNIYSVINNMIIAEQRLSIAKIDYEEFKSKNINYTYKDIVDFSSKYDGIMLKSIKNSKDSILTNFYFEGNLEDLNIFLGNINKIPNLKSLNNITLEKEDNSLYKGEIASEFIIKFN